MEIMPLNNKSVDDGGIQVLLRFSNIDRERSEYPREMRAIELARSHGWRHALEELYDPAMVDYSANPLRSKFLDLLALSKDLTALEIGLGFGQHTPEIARRVKWLDTLEVRWVNCMFTKIRCEQEGITNVSFKCGGDDCYLPFPDASYDVVFLNLVLEWCASNIPNVSRVTGQKRLLSEIRRVLKPGGLVEINTKNRFAYRLLIGGADEHVYEMRFGSALPRWLLRLVLRLEGKPTPPGYLHSYNELSRTLHEAGLRPVQSFWAVPEMRFPNAFVPIDAASIRAARKHLARQGDSRRTDLLMRLTPASLVRYFMPGFFFVAKKTS